MSAVKGSASGLALPLQMKTNELPSKTEAHPQSSVVPKYDCIKVGIDWHAEQYRVVRIIDNAAPEPAQRFTPGKFLEWAAKQLTLAKRVESCYEAGAGGFVLHRQLEALGVHNRVVAPRDLDRAHRGVQTDATDARELAMDLDGFVRGNDRKLRVVYAPSAEAEIRRQQSRQRKQMIEQRLSLASQGRLLLLGQGWRESNSWWRPGRWEALCAKLPDWLRLALEHFRRVILVVEEEAAALRRAVEQAAPKRRPKGIGALGLEEINREVCDYARFRNRKAPGGYAGLGGGVASTSERYLDLPITKAGNRRLRVMLVEAAWRFVFYQPQSALVQKWAHVLLRERSHGRARKRAIIAAARQLIVDLWRWQTGRTTPEALGWVMTQPEAEQAQAAAA